MIEWFLPNECTTYIFSFLEPKDLCIMATICKSFNLLASHDYLWRKHVLLLAVEYELDNIVTIAEDIVIHPVFIMKQTYYILRAIINISNVKLEKDLLFGIDNIEENLLSFLDNVTRCCE